MCDLFIFITLGVTSFSFSNCTEKTRLTPRSSIHSLKIRMTSHPCNTFEHTTLSYLPSVNKGSIIYCHQEGGGAPGIGKVYQENICSPLNCF